MALAVRATQTLTSSGVFTDTQTVIVGGKTYTTQTALTNVDGNVLIGANAAATLANLQAAINLSSGAGTTYAAAMTANTQVKATAITATTLVVSAKIPGTIGNLIAATETQTNAAWGAATLAGGTGDANDDLRAIVNSEQISSSAVQRILDVIDADSDE